MESQASETHDVAGLIDRYGELSRQIELVKPAIAEHKMLGSVIQGMFADSPADQPRTAQGRLYTLQVSARELQTSFHNIRSVYKALGVQKFLEKCSITLKAVKDTVGAEQYLKLVTTARTGPRTIKAVANIAASQVA